MGTDIHMAVEARGADGRWRWIPNAVACKYCDGTKTRGDGVACWCTAPDSGTEAGRGHGFGVRNYDVFGALANVRNGTRGEPTTFIAEPRGLPDDLSSDLSFQDEEHGILGDHSKTWVLLSELLAFDWGQTISRDATIGWNEPLTHAVGRFHSKFIPELVELASRENVEPNALRIVFGFDS